MGKKEAMVSALQKELVLRKEEFRDEVVETIYFGGGTPSVLTIGELRLLMDAIHENYQVSGTPEITLEANPDDLVPDVDPSTSKTSAALNTGYVEGSGTTIFQNYLEAGINRLSIGVQSFSEEDLQLMNRAHNSEEAEECIRGAKRFFDHISIDLIYGIPGMSNERWQQNIEKALSLDIPHISSYALTVEPDTALARFIKKGIVENVDDEVAQAHFHILSHTLEAAGFESYEISNFGKPGYFSRNNTAYWQQKKYIGIGPSAHSYDGERRGWNINNNPKYLKALASGELPMETEILSVTDKYNEYVMTGLRTIWGVSLSKIASEYGKKYQEYLLGQSEKHIEEHLLYLDNDILLTTKKGRFLADGIAADLFMLNLGR
jgi:oxygen-independent coproporphyrinogen-3 oxidase